MTEIMPTNKSTPKIVIIHGLERTGKTENAQAFKHHFGMTRIVDDYWDYRVPMKNGDLVLTHVIPPHLPPHAICISIKKALRAIGK